jgi:Cu/Ag efflux pump CusA
MEFLKKKAPELNEQIGKVKGVVDNKDGLVYAGPSLSLRPKYAEMDRLGLTASDIAAAVNTAMLGSTASSVLEGDRVIAIRVLVDRNHQRSLAELRDLPLRTADGLLVKLSQVVNIEDSPANSNCIAKTCANHRHDRMAKAATRQRHRRYQENQSR